MRISRRFRKCMAEFAAGLVLLFDLFWWRSGIVFWISILYFLASYVWYRREAALNFRISKPLRERMTLADVKEIERKYTQREDFNTFEKRALAHPPLDRYFYFDRSQPVMALLAKHANNAKRVLDMGCGFGGNTVHIHQSLNCIVIGLELDSLKLKEALRLMRNESSANGIAFSCGDASYPPFRASAFDCILMSESLEHLIEPSDGLAACRYLLRDGGILIISTPSSHNLNYSINPFHVLEKALSLASDRLLPPYHGLHARFEFNWRRPEPEYGIHYHFSRQELETLLIENGFQTVWRGSYEIESILFLFIELVAQDDLKRLEEYVAPIELALERIPVLKHLGQHLLCIAQKRS